jgi:hypothetical protein
MLGDGLLAFNKISDQTGDPQIVFGNDRGAILVGLMVNLSLELKYM